MSIDVKLSSDAKAFFQLWNENCRKNKVQKDESPKNLEGCYKAGEAAMKTHNVTNTEIGKYLIELFKKQSVGWKDLWAKVAKGFTNLASAETPAEKAVWIDHVYDLQHTRGSIFNKLQIYLKGSEGMEWLKRALDWKKDVTDVRDYYKRASGQLRPIVAYVAKNVYGTTMEKRDEWEGGTYKMKKWNGGTWHRGIWQGGVWEDGTWKTGMWVTGIWKKGDWESGTWMGGTWEDGKWKDGKWMGGTWKKGEIYTEDYGWVKSKVDPKTFFNLKRTTKDKSDFLKKVS
jgi:hypothetical protein